MQELEKILEEINRLSENHINKAFELVKKEPLTQRYTETDIEQTKAHELAVVKDIIRKHMNDGWISVEKYGLPKDEGVYDLTIIDGRGVYDSVRWQFLSGTHLSGTQHYVDEVHYWADNYQGNPINEFLSKRVIAWRKKPEPYRPERNSEE